MKICFKCNTEKPLSEFYKHPQMTDGHLNKCKECNKSDSTKNRNDKIEHYREYDRKRGNRQDANYTTEYRKKNPLKYKATSAVNSAVRGDRLKKQPCAWCGSTKNIHGHHEDYSKPLDIVWLCAVHHKFVHHGKIAIY